MNYILKLILFIIIIILQACSSASSINSEKITLSTNFKNYWYRGKAELTSYQLEQARYGEIHRGEAVLIFVTEDFLPEKQVKFENRKTNETPVSVLKLNFTRKFYTGIYPYSVMTSVFTPLEYQDRHALKIISSSQEWCGQTFMQMNNRNNKYNFRIYSYFQNESDQIFELQKVYLEDNIWIKIRINPDILPTGDINIIPGAQFARFRHKRLKVEKAIATLLDKGNTSNIYRLEYKDFMRILEITFEKNFPYKILAWKEKTESGFGNRKILTTGAVKNKSILLDYWNKNSVADSTYRKTLE